MDLLFFFCCCLRGQSLLTVQSISKCPIRLFNHLVFLTHNADPFSELSVKNEECCVCFLVHNRWCTDCRIISDTSHPANGLSHAFCSQVWTRAGPNFPVEILFLVSGTILLKCVLFVVCEGHTTVPVGEEVSTWAWLYMCCGIYGELPVCGSCALNVDYVYV